MYLKILHVLTHLTDNNKIDTNKKNVIILSLIDICNIHSPIDC